MHSQQVFLSKFWMVCCLHTLRKRSPLLWVPHQWCVCFLCALVEWSRAREEPDLVPCSPNTESLENWDHCSLFPGMCILFAICFLLRGCLAEPLFTPSHIPQQHIGYTSLRNELGKWSGQYYSPCCKPRADALLAAQWNFVLIHAITYMCLQLYMHTIKKNICAIYLYNIQYVD